MIVDSKAIWLAIGWTMLHFFWVGGVIGIAIAVALRVLRHASAEVRYAVAMAGLVVLALAPAAIGLRASLAGRAERPVRQAGAPAIPPVLDRSDEGWSRGVAERAAETVPAAPAAVPAPSIEPAMPPHAPGLAARLDELAGWLPWLWLIGSPLTFTWLALGLAGAERLRRQSAVVTDGALPRLCRELGRQLGIAREVTVAVCDRLVTPVLVGVVRPMILLPAVALGAWSPEQVEMVLLHELAHVRRWDNLVNLFQRLVESALFFHPAAWIVSGWVSREREHCCDAIVVSRTGRARAYAETLLALAVSDADRAPRTAVAMSRNHLVSRIRQILVPREEQPMKLSRSLIVVVGAAVLAPAFWIGALARSQPSSKAQTDQKSATVVAREEKADKPAAMIQGKSITDWIATLKDPDPAVRKRAVEVLGSVTRDQAGGLWSQLQTAIHTTMLSDKDRDVRRAAASVADGFKLANRPEHKKRFDVEQKRTVARTLTPLRLVDVQARPIAGAVVAEFFWRDNDREPSFTCPEPLKSKSSDARGEAALELEIPGHLDGASVYAIRQDKGRPLVGVHRVTREEIGKPITITMYPACRVLFRIDSTGLPALETKYNVELAGPGWWRAAYLMLGNNVQAPRPLFNSSTTGDLEFLLPPGRFTIQAYGSDVKGVNRPIEVKPEDKELFLGTIDLAPSKEAEQGSFPQHRRVRLKEEVDGKKVAFRRMHQIALHGVAQGAHDLAYSPDGKILATAHSYNADPGEVKLWDAATGAQVATLPAPGQGVVTLAFSPDGKYLAGRAYPLADARSSWGIALWDVASRREVRTFRGHTGRVLSLAFSPDGKTLASSAGDKTTRFWDVASGRETGRIEKNDVWGRSAVCSSDGQTLALGIKLWDVPGNRLRATLEPRTERFAVYSVAYAPDARSLAAAGSTYDADGRPQQAQVRLYDLAHEPFHRRAVLTFDRDHPGGPNQVSLLCSDVAFTPDGRRVVAVAMQTITVWDMATGAEQSSFERGPSSSSDRLAVSPDGRWLAFTHPTGVGIVDIPPAP